MRRWLGVPILAAALAACGGGGSGGGSPVAGADYFPLDAGGHWIYRIEDNSLEKLAVQGTRSVDGTLATVVWAGVPGANQPLEELFARSADAVRQLPGSNADPLTRAIGPLQLLRLPVTAGDSFVQIDKTVDPGFDADGDGRPDAMAVRSVVTVLGFEAVDTEAGRFAGSAHVRTDITLTLTASSSGARLTGTSTIDDWFAPDVGVVRSRSVTQSGGRSTTSTHTLVAYRLGTRSSESVAPTLTALDPAPGSTRGATGVVTASFSEPLDADTVNASNLSILTPAGQPMPGSIVLDGTQVRFIPAVPWATGTYALQLGSGLHDLAGNPLQAQTWAFTVDSTAPAVLTVSPARDATDVPLDSVVEIEFSEELDPATVTAYSIRLMDNLSVTVPASLAVSGRKVRLTPLAPLQRMTHYTVFVDASVADRYGNGLSPGDSWRFRSDPGMFSYPVVTNVGPSPEAVAIGDVNGDGRPDIVMSMSFYFDPPSDFKLFVFLQQADGTLAAPVKYDTASTYGCRAASLAIADMNGDGRNDVVIGESGCGIEILQQNPDGTLTSAAFLASPESHKIRVVDLDGDGRADIVGAGWGTSQVSVWRQLPGGTLAPPAIYPVEHFGWGDLEVGDIDNDGRPDIVVTSGQGDLSKALGMILQQPDGSFGAPRYRAVDPTWGARGVAIGDVNGDGRNDIVASWGGNSPTSIGVFYQTGNGTLAPMATLPTYDIPGGVEIADLDNDGRLDVVVAHDGWPAVSVYLQRPDGTLAPEQRYEGSNGNNNPSALAVGDVDGDGRRDIVLAGLMVLHNRSGLSTAAAAASPAAAQRMPSWQRWRPGLTMSR